MPDEMSAMTESRRWERVFDKLDALHGDMRELRGRFDEAIPELRRETQAAKEQAHCAKRKAEEAGSGNRRAATIVAASVSAAITTAAQAVKAALGFGN